MVFFPPLYSQFCWTNRHQDHCPRIQLPKTCIYLDSQRIQKFAQSQRKHAVSLFSMQILQIGTCVAIYLPTQQKVPSFLPNQARASCVSIPVLELLNVVLKLVEHWRFIFEELRRNFVSFFLWPSFNGRYIKQLRSKKLLDWIKLTGISRGVLIFYRPSCKNDCDRRQGQRTGEYITISIRCTSISIFLIKNDKDLTSSKPLVALL